ncbi:ABC transporter ATP-binding protein [Kineothrix sp. MB12-C1]|uniref:ABC transporter ATP-binding protein n=1 Tax=Kineothrix sp. MB12-C1 TaxID=3070215 RepID=UPI0027D2E3E6|nr:ABC transporter ATP-binding protein [Kineothrix sp. MB12-C1]WMC93523.1 ABC transporter ATP-binding protein [Kineothrix sp. MB12-C1]
MGARGERRKEQGRYSVWENLRYVIAGILKWQPLVIPCTIIHALAQGLSVYVWLYTVKRIIEIFEQSLEPGLEVQRVLCLVALAAITEFVMLVASNLCDKQAEGRMHDVEYRFALFWTTKVWTMPFCMHGDPEVQKNIFKARRAINSNGNGVAGLHYWSSQLLPNLVRAVMALVLLAIINPVIVILILILSSIRFALINQASIYEKEECENKVAKEAMASWRYREETADFAYGKDIRLFQMQKPLYHLLRKESNFLNQKHILAQNKYARYYVIGDILGFVEEGAAYGFLIYKVLFGGLTVADFTLYLGSVHNASTALNEIFTKFIVICSESRHVNDYRDFLESNVEQNNEPIKSSFLKDYTACEEAFKEKSTDFKWDKDAAYEFTFDHVSFQYPGTDSYALKDLSICLKAGEKLAIVGLNGAGKSTFVKLLCRLYEPTEGHIYLNGIDIRQYDLNDYWKLLAPVFQEDESFAFPIAQNVSMQTADIQKREQITKCLHDADLKDKLQELALGIDTYLYKNLNDDGIDLSGGQKQKLMLARSLYKAAPVIVLDEPTAALDAIAESKSYENFNHMAGGRTTVYISHRLSSTKFCDQIAMFEDGELVEYGTHQELMQKGEKYAQLFKVQAQYYADKEETCYA